MFILYTHIKMKLVQSLPDSTAMDFHFNCIRAYRWSHDNILRLLEISVDMLQSDLRGNFLRRSDLCTFALILKGSTFTALMVQLNG